MKKYIIAIALILTTSFSSFAGVFTGETETFSCDVRLGCNFSNIYAQLNGGGSGKIGGFKAGFSGGVNCRFYPAEIIAIESGLGVQQRGSKDWTVEGLMTGANYTSWYLEVPLIASIRVVDFNDGHFGFIDAGVYGGYGFAGKATTRAEERPIFGPDGIMNRGDFGLAIGISAFFADTYIVTFRYQQSFIPIGNATVTENSGKFFNNGFSLKFGIVL